MFEIDFKYNERSYRANVKLLQLNHHIEYQLMLLNDFRPDIFKIGITIEDFKNNTNNWYLIKGSYTNDFARAAGSGIQAISCNL